MKIFSHRGLGFGAPENSLLSYEKTFKEGFSLEIDVQKTRDDFVVVSHDNNLERQRGVNLNITDMNYQDVKDLDIPGFEEVLSLFKRLKSEGADEQLIAIHVKDENQGKIIELVVDAIKKYELEENCFIFDLTKIMANHLRKLNRKIKIGFSVSEKKYCGTIYFWEDLKDFWDMDIVWWDELNSGLYNLEGANRIKESGKKNYVVSPELHKLHGHPKSNSIEEIKSVWKSLISFGVDGICTDYPLELREVVKGQIY